MGPEGAPMPPECLFAKKARGRAAPRPAQASPRESARQMDEVAAV